MSRIVSRVLRSLWLGGLVVPAFAQVQGPPTLAQSQQIHVTLGEPLVLETEWGPALHVGIPIRGRLDCLPLENGGVAITQADGGLQVLWPDWSLERLGPEPSEDGPRYVDPPVALSSNELMIWADSDMHVGGLHASVDLAKRTIAYVTLPGAILCRDLADDRLLVTTGNHVLSCLRDGSGERRVLELERAREASAAARVSPDSLLVLLTRRRFVLPARYARSARSLSASGDHFLYAGIDAVDGDGHREWLLVDSRTAVARRLVFPQLEGEIGRWRTTRLVDGAILATNRDGTRLLRVPFP